jgi:hypothetical protein
MVVFGRRSHWTFLTFSAFLLSANFIGPVTTADARRDVQTPYDALEARRTPESSTDQMAGSPSSRGQSITSNSVLTASEIAGFDRFLGEHKKINKDLERNPERVKDTNYLKKHEDLQDDLNQHTGLREELTRHPAYLMNRRNRYELSVADRSIDEAQKMRIRRVRWQG